MTRLGEKRRGEERKKVENKVAPTPGGEKKGGLHLRGTPPRRKNMEGKRDTRNRKGKKPPPAGRKKVKRRDWDQGRRSRTCPTKKKKKKINKKKKKKCCRKGTETLEQLAAIAACTDL